jgi:hypothetical protein
MSYLNVFALLDDKAISYCLLRDVELLPALPQGGDVDILIASNALTTLDEVLTHLGFTPQSSLGYNPHRFYTKRGAGLKLDIVTEIAFGSTGNLRTPLAAHCLSERRQIEGVYALAPHHEFLLLLLHCVLDKGMFKPHRRQRLDTLCQQLDETSIAPLVAQYWTPTMDWSAIRKHVLNNAWDLLLAERATVARRLSAHDPLGSALRHLQRRALRKVTRLAGMR